MPRPVKESTFCCYRERSLLWPGRLRWRPSGGSGVDGGLAYPNECGCFSFKFKWTTLYCALRHCLELTCCCCCAFNLCQNIFHACAPRVAFCMQHFNAWGNVFRHICIYVYIKYTVYYKFVFSTFSTVSSLFLFTCKFIYAGVLRTLYFVFQYLSNCWRLCDLWAPLVPLCVRVCVHAGIYLYAWIRVLFLGISCWKCQNMNCLHLIATAVVERSQALPEI